jgi:hypothetical protein
MHEWAAGRPAAPAVTRGNDLSFRPVQPAYRGQSWAPAPELSGPVRVCARGAAGPAAVLAAHGPTRGVAPCPAARAPRAGCCPAGCAGCLPPPRVRGGRIEVIVAWRRARRSGRLCCRAWRRPGSAAGARTVSRLMPATGSGRDAIHGPAPDDRPAPHSQAAGRGHDTGAAVTCAFTAMARIWRGCPGHPRSCRHGLAGLALAGLPVPPAGSR